MRGEGKRSSRRRNKESQCRDVSTRFLRFTLGTVTARDFAARSLAYTPSVRRGRGKKDEESDKANRVREGVDNRRGLGFFVGFFSFAGNAFSFRIRGVIFRRISREPNGKNGETLRNVWESEIPREQKSIWE